MHVDEVVLIFKNCAPWAVFVIFLWGLLLLLLFSRRWMFFLIFFNFLIRSFNRGPAYVGVHHFFFICFSFEELFLILVFIVKSLKLILKAVCTDRLMSDRLEIIGFTFEYHSEILAKNSRPFLLSMERDVNEPGLIIQVDFQSCLVDFLCVYQDFWSAWH